MEIYLLYGIGIKTERAYVYRQILTAECNNPFQNDTSADEEDEDSCLKDGVFTVDGDETVPALSGYEMITTINVVEPMVESDDPKVQIEEAAGKANGVLGLTTSSQIQESMIPDSENVMSKNNDPQIMDTSAENTGDIVLEKNQTQQPPPPQEGCVFAANDEDHFA
ncbi:hypothetical protein K7X08_004332 [Anisodus acutangulus]|uniref:Uncharacterized protein n=1 Tax=Anisodus acutangulus TaxID=402998 RepID=A0A9Q1MKY3_9SOLA|nr:hypothetical protein K7X08_004332 [Anisodus acutangulus]